MNSLSPWQCPLPGTALPASDSSAAQHSALHTSDVTCIMYLQRTLKIVTMKNIQLVKNQPDSHFYFFFPWECGGEQCCTPGIYSVQQ